MNIWIVSPYGESSCVTCPLRRLGSASQGEAPRSANPPMALPVGLRYSGRCHEVAHVGFAFVGTAVHRCFLDWEKRICGACGDGVRLSRLQCWF